MNERPAADANDGALTRFVYSRRFAAVLTAFMLIGGFALSAANEAEARPAPTASAAR